jgi:hypothetical protein
VLVDRLGASGCGRIDSPTATALPVVKTFGDDDTAAGTRETVFYFFTAR